MSKAGVEVIRKVWVEGYDPLTVAQSAECPGYVTLKSQGPEAEEFWGKFEITLPVEMAFALATAISACAKEQTA